MKITLRISESLLSIYREMGNPLKATLELDLDKPATLNSILLKLGINPILVPMIIIDNKRVSSLDYLIKNDKTIILIGPLAGG